jgi:hypothetical protein
MGDTSASATTGLSVEDDEVLRRLQWFEDNGCELSEDQRLLKETIRSRDRRSRVRIPRQTASVVEPEPDPDPIADADV